MFWKAVVAATTVAVLVVWTAGTAWGMEGWDPVIPQFVVGTAAGYALGVGGAYALMSLLTRGCTGWDCLGGAIIGVALGYTGGTVLGATAGVWATGAALGVEGNVGLCFLGAVGGTGAAVGLSFLIELPELLWLAPPAAAAGATAGYNAGKR